MSGGRPGSAKSCALIMGKIGGKIIHFINDFLGIFYTVGKIYKPVRIFFLLHIIITENNLQAFGVGGIVTIFIRVCD